VTRLRLLIDQNLARLDEALNGLYPRKIQAVSVFDLRPDFHDYTEDPDLIRLGHKEHFIFLTSDTNSITKRKYPPCTHGGIIKMPGMPSKEEILERLQKLINSGPVHLRQIRGHFTHLTNDKAIIYKEHKQKVEVRF
jgi:hypothetical protein